MNNKKAYVVGVVVGVVAVLLALGLGYAGGRYAAPDKVTYKDRTVMVEDTKAREEVERLTNELKTRDLQKDVRIVRVVERAKDGSSRETVTTEDRSKSKTSDQKQEADHEVRVVERLVYKEHETLKVTERARPQWSLSLQPGYEVGSALGVGGASYSLLSGLPIKHLVANVALEKRLFGPAFGGVWINTHLDAGLSLRIEW